MCFSLIHFRASTVYHLLGHVLNEYLVVVWGKYVDVLLQFIKWQLYCSCQLNMLWLETIWQWRRAIWFKERIMRKRMDDRETDSWTNEETSLLGLAWAGVDFHVERDIVVSETGSWPMAFLPGVIAGGVLFQHVMKCVCVPLDCIGDSSASGRVLWSGACMRRGDDACVTEQRVMPVEWLELSATVFVVTDTRLSRLSWRHRNQILMTFLLHTASVCYKLRETSKIIILLSPISGIRFLYFNVT